MGVQVTFDAAAWAIQFPEFTGTVSGPQATALAAVVTAGLLRNDGGGPVSKAATQTQLLNYAVAHIAFLQYGTAAQPGPKVVGRIASAAEGSVSVTTEYSSEVSQSEAFWIQSQYGALFWQMTAPYRTARYLPAPRQSYFPGTPFVGPGGWTN